MAGTLFDELKRRKVFKVGAAYLVVAWLAVQVASVGFPAFDAPAWVLRVFILVTLIGFPLAIVLAWVLESTPEGVQVDRVGVGTKRVVGTAILLVGLALGWFLKGQPAFRASDVAGATPASPASVAVAAPAAINDQSIAVLPFENLSADPDNAFFADCIQDEILTSLSKVGGLKVISRTSTLKYGAKPDNLGVIARELGVANVLEGSVQRVGGRVRVNVQLIDARSDSHRWAETYDRGLADVFAVQSEVAQTIADALRANLSPTERAELATLPTRNPEAYEHYLRGRALILNAPTYERGATEESIRELEAAVALDPNFLDAWSNLAFQHVWLYFSGMEPTPVQLGKARAARDRLVALAPQAPETDFARALVLYYGDHRFADALVLAKRIQAQRPNDARAHYLGAILSRRLGRWKDAEAAFRRGRELSPNDYTIVSEMGLTYFYERRYAEALPLIQGALALEPDDTAMMSIKLPTLINLEGLAGGTRMMAGLKSRKPGAIALRARQAEYERDDARALALYRESLSLPQDEDSWPADYGGYVAAAVDTRLRLAALETRMGLPEGAARFRALVAEADAGLRDSEVRYVDAAWHAVRGMALAGLGRKQEAVAAGKRAVALVPEGFDALESPHWLSYLARIHAVNGEAEEAVVSEASAAAMHR